MSSIYRQVNILLIGYSDPDVSLLQEGLSSDEIVVRTENNPIDPGNDSYSEIDCILTGQYSDYSEISTHISELLGKYPDASIIRCVTCPDPFSPRTLSNLVDGYYHVDSTSSIWAENLEILIHQSIRNHTNSDEKKGSHDRIYRKTFEENPIPMALSYPGTGEFIEVNQAFIQALGYQRDEIIGRSLFDLGIYEEPEVRSSIVTELHTHAPPWAMEIVIRTKDNRRITGHFLVSKITWGERDILLITMNDITHLKEIESSLSVRKQCIQEILSSVNEGIVVLDLDLNYRIWNRFMESLTGISEKEVLGKPLLNGIPLLTDDDLYMLARKALEGITSISEDVWYRVPETGKTGWLSIIYTPYRESDGTIIGVIALVRDISERKKAEDEIRSNKNLLRSIIDTVPVSIVCFDEKGKILLANKNFGISFGVTPEIIEGNLFEDLYPDNKSEQHIPLIKKALAGREVPFNEEIEIHPGSSKRYLRGRYSPLRGGDGTINGVVSVIIDITDLKLAQYSIELINAKLNLLSSITRHDITNSLIGVLGYLTYADEEKDIGQLHIFIKKAYQIACIIREQIEFTRDYQDLGVKEPIWQNAHDVFLSAVSTLKMGDVAIHIDLDYLSVYADPLLERVIYNLVDNALRYGEKITSISSYWYEEDSQVIWVVRDDGVGVPADMKEKIFLKGVGNNTGLGLFLIREILDITGISITETGNEGEGAFFKISIPPWAWEKRVS